MADKRTEELKAWYDLWTDKDDRIREKPRPTTIGELCGGPTSRFEAKPANTIFTADEADAEIRRRIEQGKPKVSRGWLYDLGGLIADSQNPFGPPIQKAIDKLAEVGVEVE